MGKARLIYRYLSFAASVWDTFEMMAQMISNGGEKGGQRIAFA
jgi:hypothetical protein